MGLGAGDSRQETIFPYAGWPAPAKYCINNQKMIAMVEFIYAHAPEYPELYFG